MTTPAETVPPGATFSGNGERAPLDPRYPVALFPVRVETRFDRATKALLIRVYPDDILADSHEPGLTTTERTDGTAYWTNAAAAGGEAEAWRNLVGAYSPQRAAWIVRATDPAAINPPATRAATWTQPVMARLLPDKWLATAQIGAEITTAESSAIVVPLALSVDPNSPPGQRVDISGHGLLLDAGVEWTVDFKKAEAVGMAFRMELSDAQIAEGIDRLIVFGMRTSASPEANAKALGALLDAHHYTRGIAFVAQGTPTNDSGDAASGFPPPDPNGSHSFAVERGPSLATADGDGVRLARALGLPATAVDHVEGSDREEQRAAAAMNRALFPATWGYFLETMMAPVVTTGAVDATRAHVVNYVRARGPLPVFRVGGVPYGVLPVSSLDRWMPQRGGFDAALLPFIKTARALWTAQITSAPHLGRTADPDADLLELLGMDASARAVRLRQLLGEDAQRNLGEFLGLDWSVWQNVQAAVAAQLLAQLGHPEWSPRVLGATFSDEAQRFRFRFVADAPLSETDALIDNYITWIRTAALADLRDEHTPFATPPTALLYRLLRYAALTELWSQARRALVGAGVATPQALTEHELVRVVPGTELRPTPWEYLAQPLAGVSDGLSLGEFLSPIPPGAPPRAQPQVIIDYRDALATLETLPTAELDRLTTETLDLAASRLDAWMTSVAWSRLDAMRADVGAGIHVGAFAWLENLRPSSAATARTADGREARTSVGGYIHAPSMTHAATAAVLRNAYLTHATAAGDTPYALDLSSARVRQALFVLDSVQNGQAVGAVFGYQIERGLHERQVEMLIDPLRTLFPLVANKTVDSGESPDAVAARNVVDGLALRTAWRAGKLPFGTNGLPASGAQYDALIAELGSLDDTVDAVADLLLAESVHQIVRGSTTASSASLDALAQGTRPPDPLVARGLRGGTDLTHRVALIVGGDPPAIGPGWPAAPTARAAAEPRLDAWVGALLGDPRAVKCRVRAPTPTPQDPNHTTDYDITLDALGLRPLDVLSLATSVVDQAAASELDRRMIFAALGDVASPGAVQVIYTRDVTWDRATVRTIPEVLDVAQALGGVLGGARQLEPTDLVRPSDAATASQAVFAADDAMARATAAEGGLSGARTALNDAIAAVPAGSAPDAAQTLNLRNALRAVAAFGLKSAYPAPGAAVEEGGVAVTLFDQATSVLAEIDDRLASAAEEHPGLGADDAARAAAATAIAQAIFGRDFNLLPGFQPPGGTELAKAIAAAPALVVNAHEPRRWLQQCSRVRAPLQRWRRLSILAQALGGAAAPGPDVVQLPYSDGARWAALPYAAPADRRSGLLSLALLRASAPVTTEPWFGLHLDEWVELIPNATELTGLSFHYDDPGAEAAQAILLAVPPRLDMKTWDTDTLLAILNETLDLAKIRAVDSRLLGELGQLLPAIYVASNTNDDTIGTRLAGTMIQERTMKAGLNSGASA